MELLFPHERVRDSQKELIESIQEVLENQKNLIAHAPTGLGKTAAAISSALSFAIQNKLTVFFLTPMHTQHKIAIDTLKEIQNKFGTKLNVVDLVGKKNMCLQPGVSTLLNSEFNEYCKHSIKNKTCDFYTNLTKNGEISIKTKLTLESLNNVICHTEELKSIAEESDLCPYEVSCIHAQRADVIILDYLHILDPEIREHLLKKTNQKLSNTILIFDEAHRLPDKCRDVLSIKLTTFTLEQAAKEAITEGNKEIGEDLRDIAEILFRLSKRLEFKQEELLITKEDFLNEIKKIGDYDELRDNFEWIGEKSKESKKKSFSSSVSSFMKWWLGEEEGFIRYLTRDFDRKGKPFVTVSYDCLDPSLIMKELAGDSYSLICMSGTLSPTNMYKDLFGFETEIKEFENPFPSKNKLTIIVPDTTTKFTARSEEMYKKIANHCAEIVNKIPGNSTIFFPSYKIRDDIYIHFETLCEKTTFLEMPGISKEEKLDLIEKFKSYKDTGAVLIGVSSGNFGEGLDLAGDFLKGVVVVGLPLGKPDLKTQELIKYYELKFKKGWDYGYILPALIKTKQNAGRCIRSETDKGVIIYLDSRYTWDSYFKAFKKEENLRISKDPIPRIIEFFKNENS